MSWISNPLGGQVALVQLLTIDVGIAVLEGERLAGQADNALHQDLVQLLVPEGDDVAALRHRIGHHIGQPPADQQALGGDGGLHGAAGHIGQLQQHLEQHEHRRQRHQQVAVVVPQSAAAAFGGLGRRGRRLRRGGCGALRRGGLLRGGLYLVGRGGRRCGFHRLAGGGQALSAFVFHILHFLFSNAKRDVPRPPGACSSSACGAGRNRIFRQDEARRRRRTVCTSRSRNEVLAEKTRFYLL